MGEVEEVSIAVEGYVPRPRVTRKQYMKDWQARNKDKLSKYNSWYWHNIRKPANPIPNIAKSRK